MMRTIDYKRKQTINVASAGFLLSLAVAVSDFKLLGIYMLVAISALFLVVKYYTAKVPVSVCWVLLFSCLYFLFVLPYYGPISSVKIFACPLVWLVGYNMTEAKKMGAILRVMLVLAFGMAAHGLLNYVYNTLIGTDLSTGRSVDIWSGEISAATGQAVNYALFSSMSFWLIFIQKKWWLRLLSGGMLLCAVMHTIQMGSRTSLILVLISMFTGFFFYSVAKGRKKQIVLILTAILGIAAGCAVMYRMNLFGLRDYVEGSYLFYRIGYHGGSFFQLTENSRFYFKLKYLENLKAYPWGGQHLVNKVVGSYAHDLWLDIFGDAGLLTLAAVLVYTTTAFTRLSRVRKSSRVTGTERVALLTYTVAIFAQFLVEPIWQLAPLLLCSFVLIDGMLARFQSEESRSIVIKGRP